MTDSRPAKRPRRSHALGGCTTCRRRHVKCDQVRPECLTCRAVGISCGGFSTELKWMTGGPAANAVRRHLDSEKSMASMSTSISLNAVDTSLSELDARVKSADAQDTAIGPFGVLDFRVPSILSPPNTVPERVDVQKPAPVVEDNFDTSPGTDGMLSTSNDFLDWADILALEFDSDDFMFPTVSFPEDTQDIDSRARGNELSQMNGGDQVFSQETYSRSTAQNAHSPPGSVDLTSPTVQMLLQYFRDRVIPRFSAIPFSHKSPWQILNASAAVQTLAEMTYLKASNVKHANLSNLYAILAISAHSLACAPQDSSYTVEYWQKFSAQASNQAKVHLQRSLQRETQGAGKCKYKDQLMMILAMAAYAILTAQQSEARYYMIDAERLLRIRGLAKRVISRKARMLHHVYTWLRIVGESTYVLHDYKGSEALIEKTFAANTKVSRESRSNFRLSRTGPNARLDDFLRLDAAQGDGDTDLDEQKDRETGLMDIHLEDLREDAESLYLQINGVPETWLTLVAQTTRLANIIDTIKFSGKPKSVHLMESLERRKERLENMVCSFASTSPSKPSSSQPDEVNEEGRLSQQKPIDCMIRALNAALVIFFYRRVRNVNPWILQVHVDDVIQALEDFDSALAARNTTGPGTVWPAFMAGCEALTEARRSKLLQWIERGYAICGFSAFKTSKDTITDVWRKRDTVTTPKKHPSVSTTKDRASAAASSKDCTWMDISREKGLWLLLG